MDILGLIAAIMGILGSGAGIYKTMSTKAPGQSPGMGDPNQDRMRKMAMLQAMMSQGQGQSAQPQLDPLAQLMAMFQQQQPPGGMSGMGGMFGGFRG